MPPMLRQAALYMHAFARDTRGATAIEYGLIASLVFLVIVALGCAARRVSRY